MNDGAIQFEFNASDHVLTVKLPRQLTTNHLFAASDYLLALDEKLAVAPHRLTDATGVEEILFRFSEMEIFASQRRKAKLKNNIKSAIVAPQPLHLGFARMFQTLNDNPQIHIQIFPDIARAWAWLKA